MHRTRRSISSKLTGYSVEACAKRGWEFYSHGIYNTRYLFNMEPDQERAVIQDSIDTVKKHTGQKLDGWLSPALTYTANTLDLVAELGLTYVCDLFHDDQPGPVKVKGNVATIDLSKEFQENFSGGLDQEALTLNAIIHTLVTNSEGKVKRVRILVEGEPVETLGGHLELGEPVSADSTLLKPGDNKD